jgi:competence protein ComEC
MFSWRNILVDIWREERPRLFLWAPVALGLGIGCYYAWPYEPSLSLAAILTLLAAGTMFSLRNYIAPRAVFLVFFGFTLAAAASHIYGTPLLDWPLGPATVEGTIADIEQHGTGHRLILDNLKIEKLPSHRIPHRIRLTVAERLNKQTGELQPGQHIQALAKLMPLSEPMAPGAFDFRRNGFFQGVGATGYIMGKVQVGEPPAEAAGPALWFARLRQNLQTEIKRTLEGDRAGLAIILLTGDKTALSPETTQAMRAVGLAHLLAIAGLHVGLVAAIVFFLSRALMACSMTLTLRYPIKKWAAGLALLAITFYTLQVGAPVPTRRALLMAGIVLLGVMIDRVSFSLRTVALAALIILLVWPQMLLHPAFQLSFAAVIGLISIGDWTRKRGWRLFRDREGWGWNVLRHLAAIAGASFIATSATLPFSLYHFHEAGIYSMLANTLAIPLTSFWLMPLCVFADLLWPLGLASWPLRLLDPGLGLLIRLSHGIAEMPGAFYSPPPMPVFLMVIATFGGLVFCLMTGRRRWVGLGVMVSAIALGFFSPRADLLISPDGKQIGLRRAEPPELLIASENKPDKFLAEYWAPLTGVGADGVRYVEDGETPPLACNDSRCIGHVGAETIAWITNPAALPQECAVGHVYIINPVNDEGCPNSKSSLITHESFYQNGAHALYATDSGLNLRTSREAHGLRPWSTGWRPHKDWGTFW